MRRKQALLQVHDDLQLMLEHHTNDDLISQYFLRKLSNNALKTL